jgi:tRNA nucleotidyltransferase (CCA-adding enzyme)
VETSSIKRDLYRRDFTINMLAVSLDPDKFGQALDYFGGGRDTKDRVIRVLNNLSFVEDPTRILRAVRFASRFDFSIGKHTNNLMKTAIKMKVFDRVEGRRLLNEFINIFEETDPLPTMRMVEDYGIGPAIHPALAANRDDMELLEEMGRVMAWRRYSYETDETLDWVAYFMALTDSASDQELRDALSRLGVPGPVALRMTRERIKGRKALAMLARGRADRPSAVYSLLKGLSTETLLYMMAKTEQETTGRSISEHLIRLRRVKPKVTGRALIDMGYRPGPRFGLILDTVRDFRLDRKIKTIEEERDLITRLFPNKDSKTQSEQHGN